MPHSIAYEPPTGVLVVKGTGTWSRDAFEGALSEALPVVKQHGCSKVLLDLREVQPAFSFPDVFAVMRSVSQEGAKLGVDAGRLKRACVLAPGHYFRAASIINYAASLMNAFGQPVKFFDGQCEQAMVWLTE